MSKLQLTRRRLLLIAAITCVCLSCAVIAQRLATAEDNRQGTAAPARVRTEREVAIESALFARTEFFGAQALVPYPTAEARNRLADLLEKYPNDAQITL